MVTQRRPIQKAWFAMLGLALFSFTAQAFADDDPPDRVARLSFLRGDVSFQAAGTDDWVQANLNRPLGTGDHLYTDRDSRVEMDIGAATLRLDAQSSFNLLNLDSNVSQTELTEGVMNLNVRRVFEGQSYEVDTPTLAFVVTQPGNYRIDIAPDGSSTMITVFAGAGDVYGENNASYSVNSGQAYRFHDSGLQDYEVLDLPRADDFDSWVQTRDNRYTRSQSRQYVSEEVIGYSDLDDYGGWNDEPEYGHVWYPSQVEVGWAPYRYGHWAWVDPWGWSWVDNAAWGFAPFHYGRWAYINNRWGWCPGQRDVRPIYAPALVAFVGGNGWSVGIGGGGPVGWFPLGPRDVYTPWYHTSRDYFTNVNVRNTTVINNVNITNVYNNYSTGRPITNVNYAYRNAAGVTAVSRETFVGARAVGNARVQVNQNLLRNANVVSRVGITPERASFVGANAARARAVPTAQALDRRVIARTAPPPRTAPVASRIEAIKRNDSQPLATPQMRQIAAKTPAGAPNAGARGTPQRVQVVGGAANSAKPQPLPPRAPNAGNAAARTAAGQRTPPMTPATTPNANKPNAGAPNATRVAPNDSVQRGQPAGKPGDATATNPRALPSSRFAPRNNAGPANNGNPNAAKPGATTGRDVAPRTVTAPRTPATTPSATTPRTTTKPADQNTRNRNVPSEGFAPRNRTTTSPPSTVDRATKPGTPSYQQQQQQQRVQPRSTPQQIERSTPSYQKPTPQTERSTPQQYQRPTPQVQQPPRSPPQQQIQRSAPQQPQVQRVPQQQQPRPPQQERRAPQERPADRKKDKDDDGGHR